MAKWRNLLLLALCSWGGLAFASNAAKAEDWQKWSLVGEAQLSVLFFDIYHSRLFTPSGDYQVGADLTPHPLALSIDYQRDISQEDLLEATEEQWFQQGYSKDNVEAWLTKLQEIFPNVERGQNLTYVSDGKVGFFVYFPVPQTMEMLGAIENEDLNDAFLGIWLSPKTEFSDLRNSLIGKK